MKNYFIILLILSLFVTSCEGEPTDWHSTNESIRLNAKIEDTKTRASGTSWDAGDAIGIYLKSSDQALDSTIIQHNAKYINENGSSLFTADNESETLYYPDDESLVDFIGYYPYVEDIVDFKYPIDVTVQSDLPNIDFMYSNNAKDLNKTTKNVQMVFSHQLCKLVLNIEQFREVDFSDIKIIISNTATKATFDLKTGKLSPAIEYGNIQLAGNKDRNEVEAILLPETNVKDQVLWFIIGEEEEMVYKYSLAGNLKVNSFNRSTSYTLNIKLFADEYQATPAGGITDWISGPVMDVIVEQTYESPPQIKGSKKSPYTVSEAIVNQGREGVWVEGFIVGGFTGSKTGSFTRDPYEARRSSLAIADQQNETNINAILPIELPTGKVRDALNISENPFNIGKKIVVRGNLERYYSAPGLKNPKEFTFAE
ncbi:MAG: fimbrillin family protein [Fermentimonas sp.]|nr:fimbrillin family protein [Fermentimonas sp.]